jgi:hypothetical protein
MLQSPSLIIFSPKRNELRAERIELRYSKLILQRRVTSGYGAPPRG